MPRFEYERVPGDIFLNDEAAAGTQYGSFSDDNLGVWNDDQISDFVRGGRIDMYKRLRRLPVLAEALPQPVDLGSHFLTPDERILVNQSTMITARGAPTTSQDLTAASQSQHAKLYRYKTLRLQHKRYIQARVLTGHSMLLQCAHQFSCHFPCSAPDCHEAAGRGGFFITLRSVSGQQDVHYGLQCVEDLMDDQDVSRRTHHELQYFAVDGAAERCPAPGLMPYDLPSNTIENRRLRQKRAEEIDEILYGVEKRKQGKAYKHILSDTDNELNMHIHRPDDREDIDQRYKKQRLTRSDQTRERLASKEQDQQQYQQPLQQTTGQVLSAIGPKWDDGPRLICYCREPENDADLIQCSNEFCLIGWFHAQCCVDNPSLLSDRKFFCNFCTDRATSTDSDTSTNDAEDNIPLEDPLAAEPNEVTPDEDDGRSDDGINDDSDDDKEDGDNDEEYYNSDYDDPPGPEIAFSSPQRASPVVSSPGGFTPVNQRYRSVNASPLPFNLDGAADIKLRPVATYRQPVSLNADFATLADLAPFMSYELFPDSSTGLREEDILNFEAWRYSIPVSRMLGNLESGGAVHLQDLPRGSRKDLRKRAKDWVDRLIYRENQSLDTSLSGWIEGRL